MENGVCDKGISTTTVRTYNEKEAAMGVKRPNNYFDGIPTHSNQIKVFMIIVLAYIFDQMDNMVLGYVAPSVMKTFGIGMKEFAPAQSLYFIGMMVGGIVAGLLSDKLGRRKAFMYGCVTFSTATFLTGMTDNIYTFAFFRVLTGFAVLGTGAISFTYLAETISAQDRSKWSGIVVGVGHLSVPFIGYIAMWVVPMSDEAWRYLFYQGLIGYIPLVLAFFFMKESPRWLIANGRQAEAEAVIEAYTGQAVDLTEVAAKYREEVAHKLTVKQTFQKIFGDAKYRRRTLTLFCVAAGQNIPSFVFLGWNTTLLQQIGVSQADSLMISTIGAVGIPLGILVSGYVGPLGGRKISIGIQILLVGVIVMAYMNAGTNIALLATLYFLFQGVSMCCAMCLNLYMSESYSTEIRNTGTGVVIAGGRCTVAISQQIVPYLFAAWSFAGVCGYIVALCIFGGLVTLLLGWRTGNASLEEVS